MNSRKIVVEVAIKQRVFGSIIYVRMEKCFSCNPATKNEPGKIVNELQKYRTLYTLWGSNITA
jgi:hypothetical protein